MTTDTLPTRENLADYKFEAAYLTQAENGTRYYIPGKAVCVTDDGTLLWYEMPEEDMGCFYFDEMILNDDLHSSFSDTEMKALHFIRELDKQAQDCLLHVVTTSNAGGENQYAIFYSEPSEAYFKVHLDDLERVNLITANLMAQVKEPSFLCEPYSIRLDERGVFEL